MKYQIILLLGFVGIFLVPINDVFASSYDINNVCEWATFVSINDEVGMEFGEFISIFASENPNMQNDEYLNLLRSNYQDWEIESGLVPKEVAEEYLAQATLKVYEWRVDKAIEVYNVNPELKPLLFSRFEARISSSWDHMATTAHTVDMMLHPDFYGNDLQCERDYLENNSEKVYYWIGQHYGSNRAPVMFDEINSRVYGEESVNDLNQLASAKVDELLQRADAYFELKNYHEAFKYYDHALQEDPNNKVAQEGKDLSWNRMEVRNIEQDLATLSEDPENLVAISRLIQIYTDIGDYENSLLWIEKHEEIFNDEVRWSATKASVLEQIGEHEEALVAIRNVIDKWKGTIHEAVEHNEEAIILYILGNYKESDKVLNTAFLKLENSDHNLRDYKMVEATLLKGMLLEQFGKDKEAKETYELFSKVADSFGDFSSNVECSKGLMLFRYGDFKQALVYLDYVTENQCEGSDAKRIVSEDRVEMYSAYAQESICGPGTIENEYGQCVPASQSRGGGCLIATATFGSELAPQVQQLREIRDDSLLQTESGRSFMESFNQFYYSFSPGIADLERENPIFKETVKLTITPLLSSLSLLNYVDLDSEVEVLGYGISLILLNIGMYFVLPAIVIHRVRKFV